MFLKVALPFWRSFGPAPTEIACLGLLLQRLLAWAYSRRCPCFNPAPTEVASLGLVPWKSILNAEEVTTIPLVLASKSPLQLHPPKPSLSFLKPQQHTHPLLCSVNLVPIPIHLSSTTQPPPSSAHCMSCLPATLKGRQQGPSP